MLVKIFNIFSLYLDNIYSKKLFKCIYVLILCVYIYMTHLYLLEMYIYIKHIYIYLHLFKKAIYVDAFIVFIYILNMYVCIYIYCWLKKLIYIHINTGQIRTIFTFRFIISIPLNSSTICSFCACHNALWD